MSVGEHGHGADGATTLEDRPVADGADHEHEARIDAALGGAAVDEAPVDESAPRTRELLVHLLAHPEGRTREQVGLAFWPDASAAA